MKTLVYVESRLQASDDLQILSGGLSWSRALVDYRYCVFRLSCNKLLPFPRAYQVVILNEPCPPASWRITSIIMEVIADLAALRNVSLRVSLYACATKREYASDGFLCLPALRQNTHQEYKVDD
jgi:hypothetical protein